MSDAEVDALTGRALQAGMQGPEVRAWRRALNPVALDTCGCKASAKAAAVVGVLAATLVVARFGAGFALLWALAATLAAAALAKLLGMRAGERRRARLLRILEQRIGEVAAASGTVAEPRPRSPN